MARPLRPLLLNAPSRFAALERSTARWACLLLALLLGCAAAIATMRPPADIGTIEQAEMQQHETIVSGVRAGGDYYAVAATALRAADTALRLPTPMRLPTLALIEARLSVPVETALLVVLGVLVAVGAMLRLHPRLPQPALRIVVLLLTLCGTGAILRDDLATLHTVWAGLLIALSLLLRRPGRWHDAAAFGMMAALFEPWAGLYIGVMALIAAREQARNEAAGWGVTLILLLAVLTVHDDAVRTSFGLDDPAGFALTFPDPALAVGAAARAGALDRLPPAAGAAVAVLALLGWTGLRDPLAVRVAATIAAYAVMSAVFGHGNPLHYGLLFAPLLLPGLVFAPDAIRDLAHAALDRRRIIVTRIAR